MASKTITISSPNSWVAGRAVVSSTSNGSAKNSSNITITLQGRRTDGGTSYNDIASNFYIKINGITVATDTNGCRISGTSWTNILVYSGTINHNNDGTKSITITVGGQITETTFKFNEKSETFTLDSIPRYATITKFTNTGVTQTTATFDWNADALCSALQYKIGNGNWIDSSGTPFTVTGLSPGTTYNIKINVKRKDSGLWTESSAVTVVTNPIATLTNASGFSFNIGDDLSLKIKDADKNASVLKVYYKDTSNTWTKLSSLGNISIDKSITTYVLTLSSISSELYSLCPSSNSLSMKLEFGVTLDNHTYTNTYLGTAKVINSNPVFSTFSCSNVDPVTSELFGESNSNYIPKDCGNMQLQILSENKAVAQNSATMSTYSIVVVNPNGTKVINKKIGYYDVNIRHELGTFGVAGDYKVQVTAIDSRGNESSTISQSFTVLDYHTPQTTIHVSRLNGFDNEILLELTSVYSRLMLKSVAYNEITSIQYRTQSVQDMAWSSYVELTGDLSVSGNEATITISRDKNNILTSLSSEYEHNIEFVIKDKLGSYTYPVISLDKGVPNIAESDDGYFSIGMLPDWDSEAKLQVATDIMATDSDGNRRLILEEIDKNADNFNNYLPLTGGTLTGSVVLSNNKYFYSKNTDGESIILAGVNDKNAYVYGYGSYDHSEGACYYDGNIINLRSKGAINITSPTAGLRAREYGVNKVLWSGGWYMNASQTATLSESASAQPHGIVLVWCNYDVSTGKYDENSSLSAFFIPKYLLSSAQKSFDMIMSSGKFAVPSCKSVFVYNTKVVGTAHNEASGTASGITYNNQKKVLRYVLGV